METRNIKIDIQTARDWYYGRDKALKEFALQAFSVEEIKQDFRAIKTLEDACRALGYDYYMLQNYLINLSDYLNKISIAKFKLEIVRKALNLGQDLHLARDPEDSLIYFPYNPIITKNSTFYSDAIKSSKIEVIGKIKSEGEEYNVLGGTTDYNRGYGLGNFDAYNKVGGASANVGLLGCASKEIAQHFGKYFGMLITEAKYGDMVDFEIISSKYPN